MGTTYTYDNGQFVKQGVHVLAETLLAEVSYITIYSATSTWLTHDGASITLGFRTVPVGFVEALGEFEHLKVGTVTFDIDFVREIAKLAKQVSIVGYVSSEFIEENVHKLRSVRLYKSNTDILYFSGIENVEICISHGGGKLLKLLPKECTSISYSYRGKLGAEPDFLHTFPNLKQLGLFATLCDDVFEVPETVEELRTSERWDVDELFKRDRLKKFTASGWNCTIAKEALENNNSLERILGVSVPDYPDLVDEVTTRNANKSRFARVKVASFS